jgi:gliding motility-associated lipoprotein GldH
VEGQNAMIKKLIIPIFIMVSLFSCKSDSVFNSYTAITDHVWANDSGVSFNFEITDTTHYYDLNFLLRIDDSYPFSNLYILYTMTGPSGRSKNVRQNFILADKSGKWLGKGYSNIFSYNEVVMKEIRFTSSGIYTVRISQHMRTDTLNGVHDVGFSVSKGEAIF